MGRRLFLLLIIYVLNFRLLMALQPFEAIRLWQRNVCELPLKPVHRVLPQTRLAVCIQYLCRFLPVPRPRNQSVPRPRTHIHRIHPQLFLQCHRKILPWGHTLTLLMPPSLWCLTLFVSRPSCTSWCYASPIDQRAGYCPFAQVQTCLCVADGGYARGIS